jgi:hypothetical protein
MATTTTNYGFDVPTSSDLVKNGATAISTLGQDLDTFLFRPFTRNAILNGSLDIWQRGTSFTATGYVADRWYYASGAVGRTVTRQAPSLTGFQYCIRSQRDSGNSATNSYSIRQNLETVNSLPFAGQSVTVSFYARAGANYSAASNGLIAQLKSGTGTDQNSAVSYTGETNVINQTATLTTSWQRFTYTATVGSSATELSLVFIAIPTGTAGAADYFDVTGIMLEVGSQASPYANQGASIQAELAMCQRYYEKSYAQASFAAGLTTQNAVAWNAASTSSDRNYVYVPFKVTKRGAPTITVYSPITGTSAKLYNAITSAGDKNASTNYIQDTSFAIYLGPTDGANAVGDLLLAQYVASAEL